MLNQTKIVELKPKVAKMATDFIAKCKTQGIDIFLTCAYRSPEEQNILYAQGRTTKGKIVTNAKAGQSLHQYHVAFDICPLKKGILDWSGDFTKLGIIGKSCGLEWGGDFISIKDRPHFQFLAGYKLSDFQSGKVDWAKFN